MTKTKSEINVCVCGVCGVCVRACVHACAVTGQIPNGSDPPYPLGVILDMKDHFHLEFGL